MPHVTLRGMNEVYWQMEMLNRQKGTENSAEKNGYYHHCCLYNCGQLISGSFCQLPDTVLTLHCFTTYSQARLPEPHYFYPLNSPAPLLPLMHIILFCFS